MKKCSTCKNMKPTKEFAFKNKAKNIRHARCKICQCKVCKIHYQKNKQKYIQKAKRNNLIYNKKIRDYIWDYLLKHPCVDCGETNPIVLEFDHVREKKEFEIANRRITCLKRLKSEVNKCEIRCANCHRKKTAKERGYWKDKVL